MNHRNIKIDFSSLNTFVGNIFIPPVLLIILLIFIPFVEKCTGPSLVQWHIRGVIWYDIFVNCKWVATRWQLYSTHLHTNNTERHKTKKYIEQHKIWAQHNIWEQYKKFGRVRAVPRLGELYPGICLTTEEKARKNLSQDSRTIRIRKPNNKNT
jgi:hypothetical protein